MSFGIALYYYSPNEDPKHPSPYFHWAFVSSSEAFSKNNTTCYEIVRQDDDIWKWHFTRPDLSKSAKFTGIVELGKIPGSHETIDAIIRSSHPADVKDWMVTGPTGWTCATWVIKLAIDLEDQGFYAFPDGVNVNNFYKTVLERGEVLRDLKGVTPIPVLPLPNPTEW